jgi:endonuclease-3 related protein
MAEKEGYMKDSGLTDVIFERLLSHYGDPHWWPAETPFEVMVGAVLTQNCAWENVEKAIANLKNAMELTPENLLALSFEHLGELIRPAGFFTRKAAYLKALTEWYGSYGFDRANLQNRPLQKLRQELLSVRGIGKETADSILLYALGYKTFVIDAYTARLCKRIPLPAGDNYDERKLFFETHFKANGGASATEDYNIFHALIVINAKTHCKAKPQCVGCPLAKICELPHTVEADSKGSP